jgi:hypothetical protein
VDSHLLAAATSTDTSTATSVAAAAAVAAVAAAADFVFVIAMWTFVRLLFCAPACACSGYARYIWVDMRCTKDVVATEHAYFNDAVQHDVPPSCERKRSTDERVVRRRRCRGRRKKKG